MISTEKKDEVFVFHNETEIFRTTLFHPSISWIRYCCCLPNWDEHLSSSSFSPRLDQLRLQNTTTWPTKLNPLCIHLHSQWRMQLFLSQLWQMQSWKINSDHLWIGYSVCSWENSDQWRWVIFNIVVNICNNETKVWLILEMPLDKALELIQQYFLHINVYFFHYLILTLAIY